MVEPSNLQKFVRDTVSSFRNSSEARFLIETRCSGGRPVIESALTMDATPPQRPLNSAPVPKPSGSAKRNEPTTNPIPPGTKVSTATTVDEAIRLLDGGPTEGVVVLDVNVYRETLRAFSQRNRIEHPETSAEAPSRFTPEHLNILFGDLTYTEQTFLLALLRKPGALVTREELFRAIRGGEGTEAHRTHSLNQTASVLRKKLGPDDIGQCIETVRGLGFRWNREKEPPALSFGFWKVAGLAMLSAFVIVAGILRFAPRDRPDDGDSSSAADGGALVSYDTPGPDATARNEPVQAMRSFSELRSFGDPSASVECAKGHSPWRSVDGLEDTWFESAAPARAGDWISFRFPDSSDRGRRIGIRLGRPDAVGPSSPPCRVEWSSVPSAGASDAWLPLGDVDPATGLFTADLPASPVAAVRIVVTADSSTPLSVREAGFSDPEAE